MFIRAQEETLTVLAKAEAFVDRLIRLGPYDLIHVKLIVVPAIVEGWVVPIFDHF
jgi:hypothetical protein